VGHVGCMGKVRNAYNFLYAKPEGKRLLGRPHLDERIILKWILKK